MNMRRIINIVAKLAVMSGVAFAAYKLGEINGESNERIRQKYDDNEDDDYYDYSDYDEPDCGCIKPSCDRGEKS